MPPLPNAAEEAIGVFVYGLEFVLSRFILYCWVARCERVSARKTAKPTGRTEFYINMVRLGQAQPKNPGFPLENLENWKTGKDKLKPETHV